MDNEFDKLNEIRKIKASLEEYESDMNRMFRIEKEAEKRDRENLFRIKENFDQKNMDRQLAAIYTELFDIHKSLEKVREELLEYIRKEIKRRYSETEDEINRIK